MGRNDGDPRVGQFDLNNIDRDRFRGHENPEGHCVIEAQQVRQFTGTVPDNQFKGQFRQAFDRTTEADREESLYFCVCGEFFGQGESARDDSREHLREAQGTVTG